MFIELVKNDLKSKYAASFVGVAWAFAQPLINMLVLWFVFQVGLKNTGVNGVPFIVWYAPAFLAWQYFAGTVSSVTTCIKEYDYLVKQVNFKTEWIPTIKIYSEGIIHLCFIIFILVLCVIYDIPITIYAIQLIYYFICMIALLTGLGYFLSSITLFAQDIQSIVAIFVQMGFWIAPIVWQTDIMSPNIQKIIKLNPFYYICEGYRDATINGIWFWQRPINTVYYWAITVTVYCVGKYVFKKMKGQFDDVL